MKKIIFTVLPSLSFLLISCQHFNSATSRGVAGEFVSCKSDRRQFIDPAEFNPPKDGAIRVAFFDADSTLRISKSGSVSANSETDVRILPNVAKKLKVLKENGYLIYIVSNQNGVGSGVISCEIAEGALQYAISEIKSDGGFVHGYDFAENANEFRKPGIGMATVLEEKLKATFGQKVFIDKTQSFMVGDSAFKKPTIDLQKPEKNYPGDSRFFPGQLTISKGTHFSNADRLFAQNFGVYFYEATDFFGWRKYGVDVLEKNEQVDALIKQLNKK